MLIPYQRGRRTAVASSAFDMQAQQALMSAGHTATGDPYWANVVLLVGNENGTNGGTTFLDQSTAGRTMTAVANAQWTSTTPFDGLTTVSLLDGTGDYISAAASADFAFSTADFTIEAYVSFAAISRTNGIWQANVNDSTAASPFFYVSGTNVLTFGAHVTGNLATYSWGTIAQDTVYHIAAARSGTALKLFIDGSSVGTGATNSTNFAQNGCAIGHVTTPIDLNGRIVCRITKGVARYTGSFTPPTLPFPTS